MKLYQSDEFSMSIFLYQNLNLKTPIEVLKGTIQGEKKPRDNRRPRGENNKH
jgi:hypothetical protein